MNLLESMIFKPLLLLVAYLLGSIPIGYLIVRKHLDEDIRQTGSGGTGATNVMRKAGKGAAVMTFILDLAKGFIAVLLMRYLTPGDWRWIGASAAMVVVGHIYTIWLGFRGGKGVATGVGVFLALSPASVLSSLPIFVAIVYATRYVSLGSIIATATVPFWVWLYESRISNRPPETIVALEVATVICCVLVIASHHQNIRRLLNGTESKI